MNASNTIPFVDSADSGHASLEPIPSIHGCATVIVVDEKITVKEGYRVTQNEATAMEMVCRNTTIPAPEVEQFEASPRDGYQNGTIYMTTMKGIQLDAVWDGFDDEAKLAMCRDIWAIVDKLRQIPKPSEFAHLYQCGADGSATEDILLRDLRVEEYRRSRSAFPGRKNLLEALCLSAPLLRSTANESIAKPPRLPTSPMPVPKPLFNDDQLRARLYERYLDRYGFKYEQTLPAMLPRSSVSVFTHGDLTPRNIMVERYDKIYEGGNNSGNNGSKYLITGVVDWENSGWYPDY